jgi:hypothetical protein
MKAKLVVGFRNIQAGDKTGSRSAVLWPIRLQCAEIGFQLDSLGYIPRVD